MYISEFIIYFNRALRAALSKIDLQKAKNALTAFNPSRFLRPVLRTL